MITFGSLFSGIGGLDLGLEQTGMKCVFQIENDKNCLKILNKKWPDVPKNEIRPCMGLVGGDPCPIRSRASAIHGTCHPDMAGYFLAMVARLKPRWILRENVCSPDVMDFVAGTNRCGYFGCILEINSAAFTGQSRKREFVVAFNCPKTFDKFIMSCNDPEDDSGNCAALDKTSAKQVGPPLYCITSRSFRLDYSENYVYEGPKRGLRVLSHAERESLQGFPVGWTDLLSNTARERAIGNAVTVPVAKWIGEKIKMAVGHE